MPDNPLNNSYFIQNCCWMRVHLALVSSCLSPCIVPYQNCKQHISPWIKLRNQTRGLLHVKQQFWPVLTLGCGGRHIVHNPNSTGRVNGSTRVNSFRRVGMIDSNYTTMCTYIISSTSYLFETYQELVSQVIRSPAGKTDTIAPHSTSVCLYVTKNWGWWCQREHQSCINI